ncbi:MAG TPA: hypothetical protein VK498_04170, partial [Ferruginibacter sp.]|nr:hypothetical protein [Ferruginibacter sp.]
MSYYIQPFPRLSYRVKKRSALCNSFFLFKPVVFYYIAGFTGLEVTFISLTHTNFPSRFWKH